MSLIIPANSAVGGGYDVDNSLRFNKDSSDYLSKTYTVSPTSRTTMTISAWVKRGKLSSGFRQNVVGTDGNFEAPIGFFDDDSIRIAGPYMSGQQGIYQTNAVYRDLSAWYHIVTVFDTTNATAGDRIKLYVNGERITSFSSQTNSNQNNTTTKLLVSGETSFVGNSGNAYYFDGYMAEVCLIDGQALDATSFGKFDEISGIWKPIDVSGLTFGTNGFYLEFKNSSALGDDTSSNTNNFTVNNLTSDDQMLDTPTNNFCVLDSNFSRVNQNLNYSEGNLRVSNTTATAQNAVVTFPIHSVSNIYFEGYCVRRGNSANNQRLQVSFDIDGAYVLLSYRANGRITVNGTIVQTGNTYTADDIISILSDGSNVYFYKNNILEYTYSGTTVSQYNEVNIRISQNNGEWFLNFGQDSSFGGTLTRQNNTDANGIGDFYYSRASSGSAICTKNIANFDTTIINKPSNHFNTVLYTGNGSTQSITGVGFQPDWTWIKERNNAADHKLYDAVRGATKVLESSNTSAEGTDVNGLTAFNSDGFSLGSSISNNGSGDTYVSWNWKAGGTAVSNTNGSITSTVSANPTVNFSIVSWTGTGSVGTVGHGISRVNFMLIKNRSISSDWVVYHDRPSPTAYLKLNDSSVPITDSTIFNDTSTFANTFTVGTNTKVNGNGNNMIAYCFGDTNNYCLAFTAAGNGSTDGVSFQVGFRPAWIIIKSETVQNWVIHDVKRNTTNPLNARLFANTNGAEDTTIEVGDITNNGFKARTTNAEYNSNDVFYTGFAIAEFPQVATNGTALTAR